MPRRLVVLAGAILVVTASFATPVAAAGPEGFTATPLTPTELIDAPKSRSGALAKSDPALLARTDTKSVNVLVKLDVDAVATYDGRVDGFAATSPTVTGKDIADNSKAVGAYEGYLESVTDDTSAAIEAAVPTAKVEQALTTAYGGVLVTLPANRAKDLLKVAGVVAVQSDKLVQPLRDTSVDFIGAPRAWRQLGSSTTAGAGVVVGILDTGIWPEHPMLRDPGISHPGGTYDCQFGDGTNMALGPAFACNDKLVGAYAFLDTYMGQFGSLPGEFCDNTTGECSARDADGHGTHTATTAAGSGVSSAKIMGIERGPVSGIAPGASVVAFRVCLDQGCFQSDSIEAIEKAIDLGIDVINFSIGGGSQAFSDAVELAFLDAYAAGISVNASAGNSGPGASTAEHTGPWVTTVGASSYDHMYLTRLDLTADGGATFHATGSSIVPGLTSSTPVVLATSVGSDAICTGPFAPGSVAGKVVVCKRGLVAGRVQASYNVKQGGAAGMILYNPTIQSLFSDNFFVPTIMLEGPQPAADFVAFLAAHTGTMATWQTGQPTSVTPDVMTAFSSRGPNGSFIKPDVTAPGIQILAGTTPQPNPAAIPSGPAGELFQAIAGTSMSSPHAAGVSALVKAAHPDWTPGQIKSALMTSSVQSVLKETGEPADPWDRGAGSIRADRAIAPTVTFDVPAADYYAAASDVLGRVDLNLASINADPMPGSLTTTRTLTNVSGRAQLFRVQATDPNGTSIRVTPSRFFLGIGQRQTLTIEIDAVEAADGWYFGQIAINALRGGAQDAVLPVAFNKTQGSVTLTHTCDQSEVARGATTDCLVTATNLAPVAADVSLRVTAPSRLHITDVAAPAKPDGNGWSWTGTLAPAIAPTVDSIADADGGSPGGEYLPLSAFGVPKVAMTDETIANFNVAPFQFGSETYGRIAVDSNGYVVIGGGTADDNECCAPQTFPDPTRPNNVLAPFWTDLDPGEGGGVRVATLGDGTTDWLVIDWEDVPVFSDDPSTAEINSFQIWIQFGAEEGVWFAYGALEGVPSGQPMTAGAENRDGSSGVNLDLDAALAAAAHDDFVIATSPPKPGGDVAVTYSASSRKRGSYLSTASMQTQLVRGTTIRAVRINVH